MGKALTQSLHFQPRRINLSSLFAVSNHFLFIQLLVDELDVDESVELYRVIDVYQVFHCLFRRSLEDA